MVHVNIEKYKNTILFLCDKLGGQIRGKKKLAKLLYYVDFDRYEYHESLKTVTGDTYAAWKMGPVPETYQEIIQLLQKENRIEIKKESILEQYLDIEVYCSSTKPDMKMFDVDDLFILKRTIRIYGGLNGKQLEDLTHSEAPFIGTQQSEVIPFDLAFYRETDFEYEVP